MMTLTIRLSTYEEAMLRAAAHDAGVPLVTWMQKVLVASAVREPDDLPQVLDVISTARYQVQLSDLLHEAREWIGHGFSAAARDGDLAVERARRAELEEQVAKLTEAVRVLREMLDRNSSNSNKPPSSDPPGSGADARSG